MSDPARGEIPPLSKYKFLSGLQCHKRLYLECYHRELADDVNEGRQAILDAGTRVGEVARGLFPGGILIDVDPKRHTNSVELTLTALSNPSVPAVHEAAFEYDDVRIRSDILKRVSEDIFDLIEVKSGTRVREDHLLDVAIQLYVLRGYGISIRRSFLAHINPEYVYQGGDYDLDQLFSLEDVTDLVKDYESMITLALDGMRLPLWYLEPPDVEAKRQCYKPYVCPFFSHCHGNETDHPVTQLPRATQELLRGLEAAGLRDIREIPPDFPGLNPIQQRVRDCVINGRVYCNPQLGLQLGRLEYPVHFLDFETFNPGLPIYTGTRPYQIIVFQWSDHIMEADGSVRHEEFLHEGLDDPREPFARSLIKVLGTGGSILTYSKFEELRIRGLATDLPHLSSDLLCLLDGRIVDLLVLIREYCYHPGFHGSFSLKSVLPAMVSDLSYEDLEISDGGLASAAYAEIVRAETPPDRRDLLRTNLLAYCERDTEAMVRLFKTLRDSFS